MSLHIADSPSTPWTDRSVAILDETNILSSPHFIISAQGWVRCCACIMVFTVQQRRRIVHLVVFCLLVDLNPTVTKVVGHPEERQVLSLPLLNHGQVARRRLAETTSKNDTALTAAQLYQGYGTHYVDLWCGTPPQRQTVIVDTGSGM